MPLMMAFIKERGNVIDYEIPVRGNLKDPHFRLSDVLLDLVKNIFIKPATTPYRMVVRNVEKKIETAILLNWEIRQASLRNKQEKMLTRIAEFLKKYPLAKILYILLNTKIERRNIYCYTMQKGSIILLLRTVQQKV